MELTQARTYLTVEAAAKRFGVHARLIYKEIAEKRLPAVKLGTANQARLTRCDAYHDAHLRLC